MPSQKPLLSVEGVSKAFPGVKALSNVDFTVSAGEVVSLVGQNGAGKSTLMSIIGGIHVPDDGSISIAGERVRVTDPAVAEELGIGFVHQEPTLVPNMTVAANIFLNQERVRGGVILDFKEMRVESARLAGMLGFEIDPDRLVEELSLVETEVVEITKALLASPRILILDEVTAPLDSEGVKHLFELVRALKAQGIAIIFISHRLDEILEVSDRIVVLRDGMKAGEFRADEGVAEKDIISLMVGRKPSEMSVRSDANGATSAGKDVLVSVQNLSKIPYFEDVTFTLRCGEILGFAGLKGSGITPLLKTLFGSFKMDEGAVFVRGEQVPIGRPADAIKSGVGMLTNDRQREGLALGRSVEENMTISSLGAFTKMLGFFRRDGVDNKARNLAKDLTIRTPSLGQAVLNLSGGNQQKVVLAKWILRDLDVLIADEPTRGVDVQAKQEIYKLLLELRQRGKGVLVSSPEVPELLAICDRVIVVENGRLVGEVDRSSMRFNEGEILEMMHAAPRAEGTGAQR